MRSFLVFLAAVAVIGLVWLTLPILDRRGRDHEARLIAAHQLVEDAIAGSSADILRVDLFSPEISPLPGDGNWRLDGIVVTQDRAGKPVHIRYAAAVSFACQPYAEPTCGKVTTLTIEDRPLVVDGAVVAELQDVLGAPAEPPAAAAPSTGEAGDTVPSGAGESAPLPTLQLDSPLPPAAAPEVSESSEPPSPEAPVPETSTAAMSAPGTDTEPIPGDRLVFLTQKRLMEIGYDPGPVDGWVGPRTTSAIQVYQRRAGLEVDGQPSDALLEHMNHAAPVAAQ